MSECEGRWKTSSSCICSFQIDFCFLHFSHFVFLFLFFLISTFSFLLPQNPLFSWKCNPLFSFNLLKELFWKRSKIPASNNQEWTRNANVSVFLYLCLSLYRWRFLGLTILQELVFVLSLCKSCHLLYFILIFILISCTSFCFGLI